MECVKNVLAGKTLEKRILTNESVFPADVAAKELPNRKY
jgi:simple sugar transport system substrate-binding protein